MKNYFPHLDSAMRALRYGFGLPRFFLRPLSLQDCYDLMRRRVEERETNFLAQLRRAVYTNPESPYYKLLRHAGCEYRDVERMVHREGLETTLRKLGEAGVYISIEEYKGRKPVQRGRLSFKIQPEDFDNPWIAPSFAVRSGGTRGMPVRNKWDFDFLTDVTAEYGVQFDALGLQGAPYVLWISLLRHVLCSTKLGSPPKKWFLPLSSNRNKVASYYAILIGGLLGYRLPRPEGAGAHEAYKVAQWLAENPGSVVQTTASCAVRVCLAAQEKGLDISGTHFITNGEPLTAVREQVIKDKGSRVVSMYSVSEMGCIGSGCINSTHDDVHLLKGHVAMIRRARQVGNTGITVDAFRATTLFPAAPKILINMENGDYGKLETRACGCKFDELGLTDHMTHIRSFEKLTSEGMTFFAGDLARVVEELPLKFGGSPLDYQAVEEEEESGLTYLTLLVSPKVGKVDEAALIESVLASLAASGNSGQMMARVWREAGTVRVRRENPRLTQGGKVFSFQVNAD